MQNQESNSNAGATVLVLAEKPDAARKIAYALSDGHRLQPDRSGVITVSNSFDGKRYLVCSALGHLYELSGTEASRGVFPLFDIEWFPKYGAPRTHSTNEKFHLLILKKLRGISEAAKGATEFVNACDYDIEGETIGFNILQYACRANNGKKVFRAKYSTLTTEDIRNAFRNLSEPDERLANAGHLRHIADFLWGVNLSRALTYVVNDGKGGFVNLTTGRVQGPTLAFVVDREVERLTHVPVPHWELTSLLRKTVGNETILATYRGNPIPRQKTAEAIYESTRNSKTAKVKSIDRSTLKIPPRYPFDLGELQREAFKFYRFSPSFTLSLAEKLYLRALISYPRTESQKLPVSIGPARILSEKLARIQEYSQLITELLHEPKRRNSPLQGPNDDPAHPAIFPTGEAPREGSLSLQEKKLFDLVVRRFLNAFAPDAILEKRRPIFDISAYEFIAEGTTVMEKGWMKYYPHRLSFTADLPGLSVGEELKVEKIELLEKFNAKPPRYTEGSLLSKMESEGIGTKATRAETILTLIKREYVRKEREQDIMPTDNAVSLVEQLRKSSPQIVSTEMTRSLEKKLEQLRTSTRSSEYLEREQALEEVLSSLRTALRNIRSIEELDWNGGLSPNKSNVTGSTSSTRGPSTKFGNANREFYLGNCPTCGKGKLRVIRSQKTKKRFVGCTNYNAGCRTSSPLPPRGLIRVSKTTCNVCRWPMISISSSLRTYGKVVCANFSCKSRSKTNSDAV